MKLMHLSDLHLGKRVNEFSMLEDQTYILNKIIHIIDEEQPNGIILAGDIYDKPIPPAEAVGVFGSARIAVGLAHNAEPYASPLRAVMVAILVGQ